MIILNYKKSNTNFEEILKKYSNIEILPCCKCPNCSSDNLIKNGKYSRTIAYIKDSLLVVTIIDIQRVKCKDCGKTHALLPSFIVPYKTFALDIILNCIYDCDICYNFNISFDTIYKWKYTYNKFLPYLKSLFFQNINSFSSFLLSNILLVYEKFYIVNKKILMMTHSAFLNMAYF